MTRFSNSGILLRRIDHGDFDLIVTVLTRDFGKISAIAKNAKKSRKRFPGVLEAFTAMDMVCTRNRNGGLAVIQEAAIQSPHDRIRCDIKKTAYAGYWAELILEWVEENHPQRDMYLLFRHVLDAMDRDRVSADQLSLLFQMRFLNLSGFSPNLAACCRCRDSAESIRAPLFGFDLKAGGIVCDRCRHPADNRITLSKGTLMQLQWLTRGDFETAERVRFSAPAAWEGLRLLETFVPYHLGKDLRSLSFLGKLR